VAGAFDFEQSIALHAPGSHLTRQSPTPQVIRPWQEPDLQAMSHELAPEQSMPVGAVHELGPQRTLHAPLPQRISPAQASAAMASFQAQSMSHEVACVQSIAPGHPDGPHLTSQGRPGGQAQPLAVLQSMRHTPPAQPLTQIAGQVMSAR
jgi:hypothetical protein